MKHDLANEQPTCIEINDPNTGTKYELPCDFDRVYEVLKEKLHCPVTSEEHYNAYRKAAAAVLAPPETQLSFGNFTIHVKAKKH